MKFKSDSQRRAAFRRMNMFSMSPFSNSVNSNDPLGVFKGSEEVFDVMDQFGDSIEEFERTGSHFGDEGEFNGVANIMASNKMSFYRDWDRFYPADFNRPDNFDEILESHMRDFVTPEDAALAYRDDDMLTTITSDVAIKLDKTWNPAWGTRPHGRYLRVEIEKILQERFR